MHIPRYLLSAALFSLLVLAAGPNAKATILFDFEDQAYGSLASISSTVSGLHNQDEDVEILDAYSGLGGSGGLLGIDSVFYPAAMDISNGDSDVASLGNAAGGIMSVVLSAAGGAPLSNYRDNLSVETYSVAVPEPSTLCSGLFVLGLGGLSSWRRRRTA